MLVTTRLGFPILRANASSIKTAAPGVRRWWLLEKGPKAKLLAEESD